MEKKDSFVKSSSLLNRIHLLVTIFIAILGGFLSIKQFRLNENQHEINKWLETQQQELESRKTITEQSTELLKKAKEYLDMLDLDNSKKTLILISLLQLEKELRVSKTGELSDKQILSKVNALPHHMALLAGASEALAHIGGNQTDLELWIPIATTSGDIEVRKAAIDALRNIALLTADHKTLETCVESIINLTRRWNVPELRDQAQRAITAIARAYSHGDVDESSKVNTLLTDALRELEGALLAQVDVTLLSPTLNGKPTDPTLPTPNGEGVPDFPETEQKGTQATLELSSVRQLRQIYAPTTKEKLKQQSLKPLIADLQSESTKERRLARSLISDYGDQAVPLLLKLLEDNPMDYRIKVGVITALMLMAQPVSLNKGDLDPLIMLLGDKDATVRKNTAIFLGKLTDEVAIETTMQKLEDLSAKREHLENGNLIYNSVVVLGDWIKYNPAIDVDLHSSIKQALRNVIERLKNDKGSWRSTKAKIDEYLRLP